MIDDPKVQEAIDAEARHHECTRAVCFAEPCNRDECAQVDNFKSLARALIATRLIADRWRAVAEINPGSAAERYGFKMDHPHLFAWWDDQPEMSLSEIESAESNLREE